MRGVCGGQQREGVGPPVPLRYSDSKVSTVSKRIGSRNQKFGAAADGEWKLHREWEQGSDDEGVCGRGEEDCRGSELRPSLREVCDAAGGTVGQGEVGGVVVSGLLCLELQ